VAGSPFYARIKADVLKIVAAIPRGRICTFHAIGAHLDVMPRHVAYLLATLDPSDQQRIAWYRVVGGDGRLGVPKRSAAGASQAELLRLEGILIDVSNRIVAFDSVLIAVETLDSGVAQQRRPADAPIPKRRKSQSTSLRER
jgi:methylated-DNA-protein-cysteine methyltransferase related protein